MLKSKKSEIVSRAEKESVDVVDERNNSANINKKKARKRLEKPLETKTRKSAKHPNRLRVFANKFGKTLVKINSKNAFKALAALPNDISVKIVEQGDSFVIIKVLSKHLDEVIAILNRLCYDYIIIKIIGVVPSFFGLLSRLGIVVGLALATVACLICTSFITRVSVSGASDASLKMQVAAMLEEHGVKRGGKVADVDCDALSKQILSLDGVAFASVSKNGGQIAVYVKEELPRAEFEEILGSMVKATKRAVVTRVIVDGGTAVVKYGDVVNVGDLLIDGYTEYGEDKIPVQASGEVWGKVYYQKKLYFANTTLKKVYDKTKRVTKLSFFGKKPKTPSCKFEKYELEVSVAKNEFFVPYEVYTYEFREIASVSETRALTDEEMKLCAYSQVLGEIGTAVKVLDTYYEIKESADGKYVTVTVEAEEKIS